MSGSNTQRIKRLPEVTEVSMWGYYQGTQSLYVGHTSQGWNLFIRVVKARPWVLGRKKQEPYTMIDSIVIESPTGQRFSVTAWKRQYEEPAKAVPHLLPIDADSKVVVNLVNAWMSSPDLPLFAD